MPLSDFIPEYYVRLEPGFRNTFMPGQFYWAPTFYLPPHPNVLFEVNPDPTEQNLRFEIRRATPTSFRGSHRPIKSIGLHATEELVAIKAKKRLVILLSQKNYVAEEIAPHVARGRKVHVESYVCLPLYGIHRGQGEQGFPDAVVRRVQALMYNQFFYFPEYPAEAENANIYEAIGRLDRLQVFHRDTLAADPERYALTPNCLLVLREGVRAYLTGEVDQNILDLRSELIRELFT